MLNLRDNAKIWVFQSDRLLEKKEVEFLENKLITFLKNWKAHGAALQNDGAILHNHFIVIGVDEYSQNATGCSIDNLTHLIQSFEKELNVSFTNRLLSIVEIENQLTLLDMPTFKKNVENKNITADTRVFNNMIQSVKDLKTNWDTTVAESWHKRFL